MLRWCSFSCFYTSMLILIGVLQLGLSLSIYPINTYRRHSSVSQGGEPLTSSSSHSGRIELSMYYMADHWSEGSHAMLHFLFRSSCSGNEQPITKLTAYRGFLIPRWLVVAIRLNYIWLWENPLNPPSYISNTIKNLVTLQYTFITWFYSV